MLSIRCPNCEERVYLSLADWEDFIGYIKPGHPIRISLVCLQCHSEFILQATLSQVKGEVYGDTTFFWADPL